MRFHIILCLSMAFLAACEVRYSEHKMEPGLSVDETNQEQWLAYLDQQIITAPKKSENHYRKALILSEKGDVDEALQLIRRAISLNPENINYRYLMANLLLQKEDYAAALKQARLAESHGFTRPGLNQVLGALYLEVGDPERSNEYLKKALEQDPFNDKTYFYWGLLLLKTGDTLQAEEAIIKSLELKSSPIAIKALVDASINRKDYSKALTYLNRLLKNDSLNQSLLFQKATILQETGKRDSAKLVFEQLVRLDSLRPEYYQRLGQFHFIASRFDSAMFYQNKVLQLDHNNKEALLTLARISDRRGFHSSAISYYKKILVVDSTHQVARDELEKVNNKVAYLQRITRERENSQNLLQIQPRSVPKPQL